MNPLLSKNYFSMLKLVLNVRFFYKLFYIYIYVWRKYAMYLFLMLMNELLFFL